MESSIEGTRVGEADISSTFTHEHHSDISVSISVADTGKSDIDVQLACRHAASTSSNAATPSPTSTIGSVTAEFGSRINSPTIPPYFERVDPFSPGEVQTWITILIQDPLGGARVKLVNFFVEQSGLKRYFTDALYHYPKYVIFHFKFKNPYHAGKAFVEIMELPLQVGAEYLAGWQ